MPEPQTSRSPSDVSDYSDVSNYMVLVLILLDAGDRQPIVLRTAHV
jgi:hypothetical protein